MARIMKDSGLEWAGLVPENWKAIRLKDFFSFEKGTNAALYTQVYISEHAGIYPVYSGQTENDGIMGTIDSFDYDLDECLFTTTVGAKVMTPRVLQGKFSLSQNCLIMRQIKLCSNYFIYYALFPLFAYEQSLIPSYMQPSLRVLDLNKYVIYAPTYEAQCRIAAFLEDKCHRIDSVIEQTRASIEEYKKLKQSVITHAVTKGIRPDRKMKDSGMEWIGEIPEEWSLGKAKYYIKIGNGSDPQTEGDIPVYGSGANSFKTCGEYKEGPTVLIGRKGTLHIPHFIDHRYWNVDTAFDVLPVDDYNLKYYYYLACCFDYKLYISQTTLPGMTQTNYENMYLPVPQNEEQTEIASWLDNKVYEVELLIKRKEQLLSELESYKKSLIYEYVTGKKEVPA